MVRQRSKRELLAALLFGVLGTNFPVRTNNLEVISFDTLYPENWYTNILKHCMQILAELEVFDALDEREQMHLLDGCIGRIVYCEYLIAHATIEQKNIENIPHLIRGLTKIEKRAQPNNESIHKDKQFVLLKSVQAFKKKLERLLEPNNTASSSE